MREFFLNTVTDWVQNQYISQNALERAGQEFGDDEMRLSLRMTVAYRNCFQDFLIFENRPIFFYFKSGLEYFIDYNPLGLDEEIISEYKEILQSHRSCVFEIKRIVIDEGVELFNTELGYIFVYGHEDLLEYEVGNLVWARVGQVKGKYYFLSEFVPRLQLWRGVNKFQTLRPMTTKQIAAALFIDDGILHNKTKDSDNLIIQVQEAAGTDTVKTTSTQLFLQTSKKNFQTIRKKLKLENLFSFKTLNKWIDFENKKNVDFAFKALIYFVPEYLLENVKNFNEYVQAGQQYVNAYLLYQIDKNLDKKLDAETISTTQKIIQEFVTRIHLNSEFQELHLSVYRPMHDNRFKESKECCEYLIERLLKSQILFWPSFRVFANAATACFMMGEFFLAMGLIEASLRLNPKYIIGKKLKAKFLRTVGSSKISKNVINNFYTKTIFAEYERFLLEHKAIVKEPILLKDANKYMLEYC